MGRTSAGKDGQDAILCDFPAGAGSSPRILSYVMTGVSVVPGMQLLLERPPPPDFRFPVLVVRLFLFLFAVFTVILLKCLIRDAQEDLEVIMRYRSGGITGDEDRP